MDEKQFSTINNRLETLVMLLSAQLIEGKDYRDQVKILYGVGLSYRDIAKLTGKTENNIKVTIHLIKKSQKTRPTFANG
jgi:DNA-directed RNA polymerase specialized sigma24 family protein